MKKFLLRIGLPSTVCFVLTYLLSSARFSLGITPFYGGAYLTMLSIGGNYFALSIPYLLACFLVGKSWRVLVQGCFLALGASLPRIVSLVRHRKVHPFYTVLSAFFAEMPTMFFLPSVGWIVFLANAACSCLFSLLLLPPLAKVRKGALYFGEWELFVTALFAFALGGGKTDRRGACHGER